jgi:putative secretion ATPase (PEP-CTERM system associated)
MFEEYYGLSAPPFRLSPDHRFYFGSASHRRAMSYMRYGVSQAEGFIVITGDIGAGKSTLASQLLAEIDRNEIVAAQIVTSNIEPDDVVRLMLSAFNIVPPAADKAALLRAFESFLLQQQKAKRRVLLIVDEAQNLPLKTIEELRMLSNFMIGGRSLFQCFLIGQPQFQALLHHPDLEQLRQRVIASYHLEPLGLEDTKDYIEHRLRTVGWQGRPTFDDAAFAQIHAATGGVPRRINTLCSRILLSGALEEKDHLDGELVGSVIAEMKTEVAEAERGAVQRPAPHAYAQAQVSRPAAVELRDNAERDHQFERLRASLTHLAQRLDEFEPRLAAAEAPRPSFDANFADRLQTHIAEMRAMIEETRSLNGRQLEAMRSEVQAQIAMLGTRLAQVGSTDTGAISAELATLGRRLHAAEEQLRVGESHRLDALEDQVALIEKSVRILLETALGLTAVRGGGAGPEEKLRADLS